MAQNDHQAGGTGGPGAADGPGPGADAAPVGIGNIQDLQIDRELQDSYLTYAMSTIMDRALPDVRDGLKPSQRRILFAMNDLRLYPGRKHLKCAKICGDTSGNYHPHGESVIYPTLAGMAQKWRMMAPLIDPQGNFGSIDPDPPAAMRYTEARLTHNAVDMLQDIGLGTVDFQPNYDDRLTEPTVLPAKFPNLMVNGGVGIAVGMATSLAPNNPVEILDSIIRTVENPAISLADLMQDVKDGDGRVVRVGVKGPDFPTGGIILGRRGIVEGYETGRGRVTVRGDVRIEDVPGAKDRQQIVIESIPYNLGLRTLTERIVEAVKEEIIGEVADVRNESGREAMVRVVVELKRGADAAVVENQLYQHTPLQQTFSICNIALVNRQPRTLSLREMIRAYIDHRTDVIRRRTAHLLGEARQRAHILEGMIYAVCDIDEVIKLIRASRTREEAIVRLAARRFRIARSHPLAPHIPERMLAATERAEAAGGVGLTRKQAETIGAMRLIQLVGLEIERLAAEYRDVVKEIEGYEAILADDRLVKKIISGDCEQMRARFSRPRLTRIEEVEGDINIESLIAKEDVAVTISHAGYAKRTALSNYREQGRGGKGIIGAAAKDDDFIEHMFVAGTHDDLLCFTNTGRVFKIKVYELPDLPRTSKGRAMVNLIDLRPEENVRAFLAIKDFEAGSNYLTFVSAGGIVKRTPLKDYRNVNRSGLIAVGLKDGDRLLDAALTGGSDDLLVATASGLAIRFSEEDVRVMGRPAAGVKGIELSDGDEAIGLVRIPMEKDRDGDSVTSDKGLCLLTLTERGYGKRTDVDEYRVQPEDGKLRSQSRGGKGRIDIKINDRNGRAVAALGVREADGLIVVTRQGQLVRIPAASISRYGRGTQGVRVVSLNDDDSVMASCVAPRGEDDATPAP
ncbi:MAG: DNA gyrase subunit A [Phycisphaerae bacterium]|nr:DNA gyrase subunit A [Phycisphaerae bacterium]